jgi:hypothetical protein
MRTEEIQHEQWRVFLDQFSRQHLGQPITVEVLSQDAGPERVATDLPLVGVVADPKDSGGESIEIVAGDSTHSNVVHEIYDPSHLRVALGPDGKEVALEFESNSAPRTLLHFGGAEGMTTFGA